MATTYNTCDYTSAVNNTGLAVGSSGGAPAILQGGVCSAINLPGLLYPQATAINDFGEITGYFYNSDYTVGLFKAFPTGQ